MSFSSGIDTAFARPAHGGLDPEEAKSLGLDPSAVIDFSANTNPLGPPTWLRQALSCPDISTYPDTDCKALRRALSDRLDIETDRIVVGNGSTELIHLMARAFLGPGDVADILTPTFGEYQAACRLAGARIVALPADPAEDFRWDVQGVLQSVEQARPRLVFLCNPNNPTGVYLGSEDVLNLAEVTGDGLLVVDEAYRPFVARPWDSRLLFERGNVVVLRSLTKDYALAGLRLGYGLASPANARRLAACQPSWSVNSLALAAGERAVSDAEHVTRGRRIVARSRSYLRRELKELGLKVLPAAANFLLVEVGDAASFRRRLLSRGVCVRDCASFGLPDHIRVGIRKRSECQRLVAAVAGVLTE